MIQKNEVPDFEHKKIKNTKNKRKNKKYLKNKKKFCIQSVFLCKNLTVHKTVHWYAISRPRPRRAYWMPFGN